jgi:hypothetical protein
MGMPGIMPILSGVKETNMPAKKPQHPTYNPPQLAYVETKHSALVRCCIVADLGDWVDVVILQPGNYAASMAYMDPNVYKAYPYHKDKITEFDDGHYKVMRKRAETILDTYRLVPEIHQKFKCLLSFYVYCPGVHVHPPRGGVYDGYNVFETEPGVLACTCPQFQRMPTVCKHTEFVLLSLQQMAVGASKLDEARTLLDGNLRGGGSTIPYSDARVQAEPPMQYKPGRGNRYVRLLAKLTDPDTLIERRKEFDAELEQLVARRKSFYTRNVDKDF